MKRTLIALSLAATNFGTYGYTEDVEDQLRRAATRSRPISQDTRKKIMGVFGKVSSTKYSGKVRWQNDLPEDTPFKKIGLIAAICIGGPSFEAYIPVGAVDSSVEDPNLAEYFILAVTKAEKGCGDTGPTKTQYSQPLYFKDFPPEPADVLLTGLVGKHQTTGARTVPDLLLGPGKKCSLQMNGKEHVSMPPELEALEGKIVTCKGLLFGSVLTVEKCQLVNGFVKNPQSPSELVRVHDGVIVGPGPS